MLRPEALGGSHKIIKTIVDEADFVERRPRDDASDPVLVERIRDEIRRDV